MLAAEDKRINFNETRAGYGRFLGKFRTSLNLRLAALFILVALVPMIIIATLSIQKASVALNDIGLSKVAQENDTTKDDLLTFLGQQYGLPVLDDPPDSPDPGLTQFVSYEWAQQQGIVPIKKIGNRLTQAHHCRRGHRR